MKHIRHLEDLAHRPRVRRLIVIATLAIILLVGVGVRCHFYVGMVRADSFWTTASAHSLIKGDRSFDYSTYYGRTRRILIYGTIGMIYLFGESDLSASLLPLFFSLGTVLVLFFLGRRLWSPQAGLLAAGIYALAPSDIALSSFLLPDPIMPFFVALALLLFVIGRNTNATWLKTTLLISVGALAALSFLVRENGPVILGMFGLYWVLFDRRRWRDYARIAVGLLLMLIPFILWLWDDVLLYFGYMFNSEMHSVLQHLVGSTFFDPKYLKFVLTDRLHAPVYIPALFVFAGAIIPLIKRNRNPSLHQGMKIVLSAFLWMYLYIDFIGPHLHGYGLASRYASVLLPSAALATGWGLWKAGLLLSRWLGSWRMKSLVAFAIPATFFCFLIAISFGPLSQQKIQYRNGNYSWKEPAEYVGRAALEPIYFLGEDTWNMKMSFFLQYRWPDLPYYVQATGGEYVYPGVKPKYLDEVETLQEEFREWYRRYVMDDPQELTSLGPKIYRIEDAYVLVNPNTFVNLSRQYLIPEDWQIVQRFQEMRNWRGGDRILYYAPQRDISLDSGAWIAEALKLAEQDDLEKALQKLRFAVMLDPENQTAREIHESMRLRLLSEGGSSDELNVALLQAGTRIEHTEGDLVNPLYNVGQALTLPRENRWIPQHYLYFDGSNQLPVSVTLNFGQLRTIHCVKIEWRTWPSVVGASWEAYADLGDGNLIWVGRVEATAEDQGELRLESGMKVLRLKLLLTSVSEEQRSRGFRIEQIVAF